MKKFLCFLMCVCFAVLAVIPASAAELEYVVFGTYPQSEAEKTEALETAEYDKNGDAVVEGKRYRRVMAEGGFRYFTYEPLVWQKAGDILISRYVIDCKMFDDQEEKIKDFMGGVKYADPVEWQDCSLRVWLNGEFSEIAFTAAERALISDEVRLMSLAEAKSTDKTQLCKNPTDFAVAGGIELRNNAGAEWFLQDVSPVTRAAICTVKNDGTVNDGITVIANEKGIGLVPCIKLNDFSGIESYTEAAPERMVEIYYPGGRTKEVKETEISAEIARRWYVNKADAMQASGISMKSRFESSALNGGYNWRLYSPTNKSPYIDIDAEKTDMTPKEAVDFIKPITETFYTGNMDDYMEVHVTFEYTKESAATYDEFTDTVGESIHDAIEACWSGWGKIICSDGGSGRLTGTSGARHTVTVRLKINSDGQYTVSNTNYNNILHELANDATAYSSRPIGQIQYLRHYYGQNTIYDGRQFNNNPNTLIEKGVGICGSYANFTSDFCRLVGIPCIIYTNDTAAHAWNGVYIEGKWYHIDHTGSPDKEFMRTSYSNYKVGDMIYSFNPSGFPADHTAEKVSFLEDSYLPVDNMTPELESYVTEIFAAKDAKPSVTPEADKEIKVLLNGKELEFDVNPIIENGRTLVPMRKIFESLGATVYWNEVTQTATGVRDVTVVSIAVDSDVLTKNGENITLDVPARLIGSRTLVPVRVIAESFGLEVSWDYTTYTVTING